MRALIERGMKVEEESEDDDDDPGRETFTPPIPDIKLEQPDDREELGEPPVKRKKEIRQKSGDQVEKSRSTQKEKGQDTEGGGN